MRHKLEPSEVQSLGEALNGSLGNELVAAIFQLKMRQPVSKSTAVVGIARELGLLDESSDKLTDLGHSVGDSVREYYYWMQRGRALPFASGNARLSAEYYRNKTVLEIGSGAGCNLMSLANVGCQVFGLEPVEIYRQMAEIFADRENIANLKMSDGTGEDLPYDDGTFDLVLCVSSHQYMDIRSALREMHRVLRPGGEVHIIGGTFPTYLNGVGKMLVSQPRRYGKEYLKTIVNTMSYSYFGSRVLVSKRAWSTSAPIYPTSGKMDQWFRQSGFSQRQPDIQIFPETSFSRVKEA